MQIATIAALAGIGTAQPHLTVHIEIGLSVRLTTTEIIAMLMQVSVYAGF